jgi:hypothetical protein
LLKVRDSHGNRIELLRLRFGGETAIAVEGLIGAVD